jgi:hypothetical protein
MNDIQNALQTALTNNPAATNEEIAIFIRQTVQGAKTTPASVSSMKSRLKGQLAMGGNGTGLTALAQQLSFDVLPSGEESLESLEDAKKRISLRYNVMEKMCARIVKGGMPSLIVSGPPGLGKSHTVLMAIEEMEAQGLMKNVLSFGAEDDDAVDAAIAESDQDEYKGKLYDILSGSISAVGLFKALWDTRNGGMLVLDDTDEVFRDEVCLNLLKNALDSGKKRMLTWRKEANWLADYGISRTFEYKGQVIFLTNIDFENEIAKNGKMAEHFKALIDRSYYLCLTLRTKRDFMIRIRQVAGGAEGMLCTKHGLTIEAAEEVLDFITENQDRFYNLSLRLTDQIARMRSIDEDGWRDDVEATKMRSY